jgi:hypothetical protein
MMEPTIVKLSLLKCSNLDIKNGIERKRSEIRRMAFVFRSSWLSLHFQFLGEDRSVGLYLL